MFFYLFFSDASVRQNKTNGRKQRLLTIVNPVGLASAQGEFDDSPFGAKYRRQAGAHNQDRKMMAANRRKI
jgi:hypothetical protein